MLALPPLMGGEKCALLLSDLGEARRERADFVEAATERRLLVSGSRVADGEGLIDKGTLRGGAIFDLPVPGVSIDIPDELSPDEADSRSGVDTAGLAPAMPFRADISGVEAGVGVLLYTSERWKVFA